MKTRDELILDIEANLNLSEPGKMAANIADYVITQRLIALAEYQNPRGVPLPGDDDTKEPFWKGTASVATQGGYRLTEAYYFAWEGMNMAITRALVSGYPPEKCGWRVTEPISGRGIPEVRGETIKEAFASWQAHVTECEVKRTIPGGLADYLRRQAEYASPEQVSNAQQLIKEARGV